MQEDNSKFNLINIHSKITNHTLITTSMIVATAALILITIFVKEYLHNRRIKKKKTTHELIELKELRNQQSNNDPSREYMAAPHTYPGRQAPMDTRDHNYTGWQMQAPGHTRQYLPMDTSQPSTYYGWDNNFKQLNAYDPYMMAPGPSTRHEPLDTYTPAPGPSTRHEPQADTTNTTRALTHSPPQDKEDQEKPGKQWKK